MAGGELFSLVFLYYCYDFVESLEVGELEEPALLEDRSNILLGEVAVYLLG
jgi:hypothetical protein